MLQALCILIRNAACDLRAKKYWLVVLLTHMTRMQCRETLTWEALQLSGEAVPPGLRERQSRCEREGLTKQHRKKEAPIAALGPFV